MWFVLPLLVFLVLPLRSAHAYNNGMGKTPPMGWNSWCTDSLCNLLGKDPCTEKEVQTTVVAMVEHGLLELGYDYVALDDCWSTTERDADGHLQADTTKFPNGMKAVADFVHAHGMKFGLYTSVGDETCKGKRPGSYAHFADDAQTLTAWGVDMIKMDHCGNKHNVSDQELYGTMSAALNQTDRPVLFSLCSWGLDNVWEWGANIAQMYRIQMDHLPFWKLSGKRSAGAGYGQGTYDIIEWMATLQPSKWTTQYGWMDPDFLMTEYFTMDFIGSRTEYTFWSLWSAPLLISTDLRKLASEDDKMRIITNKEVIAINQDPLGTGGDRIVNNTDGTQVWYKPLANGDVCVVLYNSGTNNEQKRDLLVSVHWSVLPAWAGNVSLSVKVRDLWEGLDMGVFESGYNATLKVRDVKMLRLTKVGKEEKIV
jgi:alpha-galactosidase